MRMEELANHILAFTNESKQGVSNMKLQKVLYLTLVNAHQQKIVSDQWLAEHYDQPFYVWQFGPIEPRLYDKFSVYGASRIFAPQNKNPKYEKLNPVIEQLLTFSIFDLIPICHSHAQWKNNRHLIKDGKSKVEYSLNHIQNPYA